MKPDEDKNEILPFPFLSSEWYASQQKPPVIPADTSLKQIDEDPRVFPALSKDWYQRRGMLLIKNDSRKEKPNAEGSLKENIENLEEMVLVESSPYMRKKITVILHVGKYLLANGPIVQAKELGNVYTDKKNEVFGEKLKRCPRPTELLVVLSPYLNVQKIHIKETAFFIENRNQNVNAVAQKLELLFKGTLRERMNAHLESEIGELFKTALRFADTKKDRDLLKGLFACATSTKFVAKLQGTTNKSSIMASKNELEGNLIQFKEIEETSQVVRNDMTNEQQRRLTRRIISSRKSKEFRSAFDSRGRPLLADVFPELGMVLQSIFESGKGGIGGGIEAHPRLTSDIMFRSRDNNLYMWQAREILLQVAPPQFSISLSSCFNYTDSYKEKTLSAKRHHSGKNVNAKISLKPPPRDSVSQQVVNLHWSTKSVNLLLEQAETNPDDNMVDSRDAKAIICGDIQPVQNPGKSWKPISYEDHTFDQSRVNAVVPMTHLFIDLKQESYQEVNNSESKVVVNVTRTGKPVTLLYLGISEPETTFRAMNEVLYLLTVPSLDSVFRNPTTGTLKNIFSFIVDNGHGEDPDSKLTQMCMARILCMLHLTKINQRSFAERHSKRNYVERVHAAENESLSRHGAFSSTKIHPHADPYSEEHLENMEAMAQEIRDCLSFTRFGGRFLECFRGVNEFIFNDEDKLKEFIHLSEEKKIDCAWSYEPIKNEYFHTLVNCWNVDENFKGSYSEDYKLICNAKADKYGTQIWDAETQGGNELLQPIPDYIRWVNEKGELHYLSLEKTQHLMRENPAIVASNDQFLPRRILDTFFNIEPDPPEEILKQLAILSWLPIESVREYLDERQRKFEKSFRENMERETWRKHHLYKLSVGELQQKCRALNILFKGPKCALVKAIAKVEGETPPNDFKVNYSGNLSTLPKTVAEMKKLPIASLQFILRQHNLSISGNKDDLVLRLYLLRHGRSHLTSYREVQEIKRLVDTSKTIVFHQLREEIINIPDIRRMRKFVSKASTDRSVISLSPDFKKEKLCDLFDPMLSYIQKFPNVKREVAEGSQTLNIKKYLTTTTNTPEQDDHECYFEIGKKVKIKWTADEIGDTGWRPGWYVAEVQSASIETDEVTVVYVSEPDVVYTIEITPLLAQGKLR